MEDSKEYRVGMLVFDTKEEYERVSYLVEKLEIKKDSAIMRLVDIICTAEAFGITDLDHIINVIESKGLICRR